MVSGQYEKVFPFDIYPVQLIKSIVTNDIEKMENLGIYEVALKILLFVNLYALQKSMFKIL